MWSRALDARLADMPREAVGRGCSITRMLTRWYRLLGPAEKGWMLVAGALWTILSDTRGYQGEQCVVHEDGEQLSSACSGDADPSCQQSMPLRNDDGMRLMLWIRNRNESPFDGNSVSIMPQGRGKMSSPDARV